MNNVGEQTLDLDRILTSLYTTAHRFLSPPPSSAPTRPPERRRTRGIDAGNPLRLPFALGNCSKGKGGEETRNCRRAVSWVGEAAAGNGWAGFI